MIEIKPYEKNAKEHPEKQVELIAKSIARFGWRQPIVVDRDGVIVVGHGRWQAHQEYSNKLGMKAPWIVNDEGETISGEAETTPFTLDEEKAYRLADNQINALSGFDMALVVPELKEMPDDLFAITGFDSDLLLEEDEKDDAIPPTPNEAYSKLGDVYEIGGHRVVCGDSTEIEVLDVLMNDRKADMWLTDPPYNVAYEGKTKDALTIENDEMEDSTFGEFLRQAFSNAVAYLKAGGVFYIWHADSEGFNFRKACKEAGLTVRQCLIWNKNSMVMGRQDYHWKHEPCLYGWKDGSAHLWNSDRTQTTVLNFDRPSKSENHPTMKPVDLLVYQLTNNTKGEDIILDTFLGSGSTLIAAEKTGRVCYGVELDPKYVDVIISRWVEYTGIDKVTKNGTVMSWSTKS
jgi:site-specific DNA-methyltransferase (adenine-specific)